MLDFQAFGKDFDTVCTHETHFAFVQLLHFNQIADRTIFQLRRAVSQRAASKRTGLYIVQDDRSNEFCKCDHVRSQIVTFIEERMCLLAGVRVKLISWRGVCAVQHQTKDM